MRRGLLQQVSKLVLQGRALTTNGSNVSPTWTVDSGVSHLLLHVQGSKNSTFAALI